MRLLIFLASLLSIAPAKADQAWDFLRVQCINELGELQIDHFQHSDPDVHGYLKKLVGRDAPAQKWQREFAAKQHIYEASRDRTIECQLPNNRLKVKFVARHDNVGQTIGRLTVYDSDRLVVRDAPFIAFAPEVQTLRVFGYGSALRIELTLRGNAGLVQHSLEFCGAPIEPALIRELAEKPSA